MSYYLGLSILSNNKHGPKPLSAEAWHMVSALAGRSIAEGDIAREGQGRPYFVDRGADFNISHSGALAAVSLVCGANLRTGCDVELVRKRPRAQAIAEEFFSVPERDYVLFQEHFIEERFLEIWTLKECFLKLRGLSVFDMTQVPSFIHDGDFAFDALVAVPLNFYLYELSGANERYILATAIEGGGGHRQPEIRRFSQEPLDCRCIAGIVRA